ncbi:MAG: hypothetical protein PHY99_08630, partial [Bacteroidales bacterium]|nr:hypothetical protein [Bacteroidales bacterium]
ANVYTAGFNAQYNGRLSSIIDLKTRDGNSKRLEGKATLTTFGCDLTLHGPLMKEKPADPRTVTFLLNYKGSYIDKVAPVLYPYLDSMGIPYQYGDFYGKVSTKGPDDHMSVFGHHFTDRVSYDDLLTTSWQNNGLGCKLEWGPKGWAFPLIISGTYSDYQANIQEADKRPQDTRYRDLIWHLGSGLLANKTEIKFAIEWSALMTEYSYLNLDKQTVSLTSTNTDFVWYGLVKSTLKNWILEPGINIHWFSSQNYYSFEPRLQVKYNISPTYSLSFATGLYAQDLLSSVSEQDITCLFQGYYSNPEYIQSGYKGKEIGTTIQKSAHGVVGITAFYPNNLKLTAEVFVKDFYRLVNFNRNKVYEDTEQNKAVIEYLKKNFIFENGWSYGLDLLADYQNDDFSFWLGYSLGFSTREDEYSTFTPHFDRRHNINLLINYQPTKKTSIKVRWNLSSGYPFTQNAGLYEEIRLTNGTFLQSMQNGNLSVYYGAYNEGRLPWYHRLDISAYKTLDLSPKVTLELNAGIMNVYNRKNVFYLDRLSGKRLDQLPIMPNAGMVLRF